jgi:hypothetical protein
MCVEFCCCDGDGGIGGGEGKGGGDEDIPRDIASNYVLEV